jgi:hypothetical protein
MNSLNNKRDNLRIVTHAQNQQNKRRRADNTSGFKGVYFAHFRKKPWIAMLGVEGQRMYLGGFLTAQEAHEAYKAAAIKHCGRFARWD